MHELPGTTRWNMKLIETNEEKRRSLEKVSVMLLPGEVCEFIGEYCTCLHANQFILLFLWYNPYDKMLCKWNKKDNNIYFQDKSE